VLGGAADCRKLYNLLAKQVPTSSTSPWTCVLKGSKLSKLGVILACNGGGKEQREYWILYSQGIGCTKGPRHSASLVPVLTDPIQKFICLLGEGGNHVIQKAWARGPLICLTADIHPEVNLSTFRLCPAVHFPFGGGGCGDDMIQCVWVYGFQSHLAANTHIVRWQVLEAKHYTRHRLGTWFPLCTFCHGTCSLSRKIRTQTINPFTTSILHFLKYSVVHVRTPLP
jgi:hypothetical protein